MPDDGKKAPGPRSPEPRRVVTLTLVLIVVSGVLVLLLRSPDPIVHPTLFAEDGRWLGYLLNDPVSAYLHSRPDYLVLGQTLMLDLAIRASLIATGGTLALLPQAIAFISYGFWALFAGVSYLAFARWISVPWRLAIAAGILLLPIGDFMNEVVGRIFNLGYLFLPLAFMLCLLREERVGRLAGAALAAGLVICIFTNPIVVAVVGAHLGLRLLRRVFRSETLPWLGDAILALALLGFVALFVARLGQGANPPANVLVPEHLLEMAGARSLLYPFLFAFYERLSDPIVAGALVVFALLVGVALFVSPPRQRLLGLCLLAATLGSIAVTVATRPFLTGVLDGYATTFPGRYYMAQNIFSLVTFVWALSRLPKAMQIVGAVAIIALAAPGAGRLFEFGRPQMVIATDGEFADQVAAAVLRNPDARGETPILVDAYPPGWSIAMPARLAIATARATAPQAGSQDVFDRVDLGRLPYQWGLHPAQGGDIALDDRFRSSSLNDLREDRGMLRSTGQDPYFVLDLDGIDPRAGDAPLFSFDLACENRTRFIGMQLFWATVAEPQMSEERSIAFFAGPGRNVVPLDSHPAWPAGGTLSAIRLDIDGPRACSGFGFANLALGARAGSESAGRAP